MCIRDRLILVVNVVESAFNPNEVLTSDVFAFNPIAVLSVAILAVHVAESAFSPQRCINIRCICL